MCTVLPPPGDNPIAVNKISYHNTKIDLEAMGWEEWTGLLQLRLGTVDGRL